MVDFKILVADDHPIFRAALVQALNHCKLNSEIIEVENYRDAAAALDSPDFDLALVDLNMPGEQGVLHLAEMCRVHPDVVFVVVSGHDDIETIRKVKQLGVSGFISKSSSMEELVTAIKQVVESGGYWPDNFELARPTDRFDPIEVIAKMTPQQKRVLSLIADGKLNKQIAYDLNIQETTIKQHVSAILKKLNVYNRTQAGLIYRQAVETASNSIKSI